MVTLKRTRASARVHGFTNSPVAAPRKGSRHAAQPSSRLLLLAAALVLLATLWGLAGTASAAPNYDMRGEWTYTLTCSCNQTATGTMVIRQEELTSGAYSGTANIDGILEGTASGIATDTGLSVEFVVPHAPPSGEAFTFTAASASIEAAKNEFTGAGVYGASANHATGEVKAKRIRTLPQIEKEEQEAAQRAKEAREKAEREAKEKAEREAAEKPIREKAEAEQHEKEAKEQQATKEAKEAQEAKERQAAKEAQEAKEKQAAKEAQEAKERQAAKEAQEAKEKPVKVTSPASHLTTGPARAKTKTISVSSSGVVSIELSNPDGYAISGEVTLNAATAAKSAGKQAAALAAGSFSIAAHATKTVKLKLSRSAAAELAGHKSLRVTIKIVTSASDRRPSTKTYSVTLQALSRTKH